eukprot:jgi/Bigna1/129929/aug1.10_g4637
MSAHDAANLETYEKYKLKGKAQKHAICVNKLALKLFNKERHTNPTKKISKFMNSYKCVAPMTKQEFALNNLTCMDKLMYEQIHNMTFYDDKKHVRKAQKDVRNDKKEKEYRRQMKHKTDTKNKMNQLQKMSEYLSRTTGLKTIDSDSERYDGKRIVFSDSEDDEEESDDDEDQPIMPKKTNTNGAKTKKKTTHDCKTHGNGTLLYKTNRKNPNAPFHLRCDNNIWKMHEGYARKGRPYRALLNPTNAKSGFKIVARQMTVDVNDLEDHEKQMLDDYYLTDEDKQMVNQYYDSEMHKKWLSDKNMTTNKANSFGKGKGKGGPPRNRTELHMMD